MATEVIQGTSKAFAEMLSQRGIYTKLKLHRSTISNMKRNIAEGNYPTIDTMEELLLRAGAKVVSEKIWVIEKK